VQTKADALTTEEEDGFFFHYGEGRHEEVGVVSKRDSI
jgi:hypothetical protein